MLSNRSFFVAAACVLPLAAVACGSSDNGGAVTPEGTHHGYVISKTSILPEPGHTTAEFSLDLGSKTSSTLDGRIDTKLNDALATLAAFSAALNAQTSISAAIARGTIILLVDFQSKDFSNSNAGFAVKFGGTATPAPCNGSADTTCGHHLAGGATITLAANSPTDDALTGKLSGGAFTGGPGEVGIQIAIGSTTAIPLTLVHARAKVTSVSDTKMSGILAGLITVADLKDKVGKSLLDQVTPLIAAGCNMPTDPPGCGCTEMLAKTVMMLADGSTGTPPDCRITVEELLGNPVTGPALAPDSCSMDTCTAADSLSVGMAFEAAAATIQ